MSKHIDSREILEIAAYLCRVAASGRYDVLTHRYATQMVALGEAMQAGVEIGTTIRPQGGSLPHFSEGSSEHLPLNSAAVAAYVESFKC